MKRTRRIEIVRYSSRVTLIQGVVPPADTAVITQPSVIGVTLGGRETTPPTADAKDRGSEATGDTAHETPRRRAAFKLLDLLRLRR